MKTNKTTLAGSPHLRFTVMTFLLSALLLLLTCELHAATLSWSGGGGANANWNNSANWGFAGIPANGDTLVFPSGQPNPVNTNNIASLVLNQIRFAGGGGGYIIRGNAFTITNNIQATNTAGANTIENSITLSTIDITVNVAVDLTLSGALSGSVGVTKTGVGTLTFSGNANNIYTGPTVVNGGLLELGKTGTVSINSGSLTISSATVREIAGFQMGSIPITINASGLLDLNGFSDTIGNSYTFSGGGDLQTGAGTLFMGANSTLAVSGGTSTISGNVNIGSGTLTIQGSGSTLNFTAVLSGSANIVRNGSVNVQLAGANTFTGSLTANGTGYVWINDNLSLGATNGGTILNESAWLAISSSIIVSNEALTLNSSNSSALYVYNTSTNSWTGNVTLSADTTIQVFTNCALDVSGPISGTGDITKFGPGTLTFSGPVGNTYVGTTTVEDGALLLNKAAGNAIPGAFVIGDDTGAEDSAVVRMAQSTQFPTVNVTVNAEGLLDLNDFSEIVNFLTLHGGRAVWGRNGTSASLSVNGDIIIETPYPLDTHSQIGGLLNVGGGTQFINFPVGSLAIGAPELDLDARVTGSAAISVFGNSGDLYLNSSNDFTGGFTVDGGNRLLVHIGNDFALGDDAAGTTNTGSAGFFFELAANFINEPMTLCGGGPIGNGGVLSLTGGVNLNTNVILACDATINCPAGTSLTINGVVSGPGGFTKVGTGTLTLGGSADNIYTGNTFVNEGILQLGKSGAEFAISQGALTIGDGAGGVNADIVRYTGASTTELTVSVPIVINVSGLLDLNGHNDDVGPLTFNGGDITTGVGTLTMFANATVGVATNGSTISGNVQMNATRTFNVADSPSLIEDLSILAAVHGPGGITKTGNGLMVLQSSNNYSGLTTISAGTIRAQDDFALGTTNNGTTVSSGATLGLRLGIAVGQEALTLNGVGFNSGGALASYTGSNSWAGPVTLASATTVFVDPADFLNLSGVIDGVGALTKTGTGELIFSGSAANTYAGATTVNQGTLTLNKFAIAVPADLVIGDGIGGALSDVVREIGFPQLATATDITIASSGLLDLNEVSDGFGTLSGTGQVDTGSTGSGQFLINGSASTTYSGVIVGAGNAIMQGSGTFTLTGTNTYTGNTTVSSGSLIVNGFQPQSPVSIGSGATLGGTGTVGNISASGAVAPGVSPGMLTSSNVVFAGTGTFPIELNGTIAGSGYDQLNIRGTNSLTGAALSVNVGFAPTENDLFRIINNDSVDAITGTFDGLPEGTVVGAGNFRFRVSYVGGTGNDVTLTVTNQFLKPGAAFVFSGNGNGAIEPNECNLLSLVVSNLSGVAMNGLTATLRSVTPGVVVVQPFSTYPNIPSNNRRTNDSLFQVTTVPGFACGTNVDLELEVVTAAHGTLIAPFSLPSGVAGAGVRFNNNIVTAIPDASFVNSTVPVAGITTPLKKVVVLLHITHTAAADLDVSLIGPDGTTVELTSDNGGVASDYGVDCTDPGRTTFDSTAATAITAGVAPYVGTFRPEQSLTNFNEKSGADVNGLWTLHVVDDTPGAVGSIRCWSLILSPTACSPGSGICELCPDVTITSALGPGSLTQTNFVTLNSVASTCGAPKVCPGTSSIAPIPYDSFTFRNGPTNACVTVTLENLSPSGSMISAAYLGSFNPANPNKCVNYLADAGFVANSSTPIRAYSFNVGSNATFAVTVLTDAVTVAPYRLRVSGGDCRPALDITQASPTQVKLDWTTASAGYQLERTNALVTGGPAWPAVTNIPIVINSRFTVTNSSATSNQFFRLRKPLP